MKDKTVCIAGLGYVSLPLAKAFVIEKNKSVKSALMSVFKKGVITCPKSLIKACKK